MSQTTLLRNLPRISPKTPCRSFATDASKAPPLVWKLTHGIFDYETPMTEPFPRVQSPIAKHPSKPSPFQTTKLDNGVQVVSQHLDSPVSAVALFVAAGSRHEAPHNSGVTHLLERLAFKGSTSRSKFRTIRDLERSGALVSAAASRESIAYAAEAISENVPVILPILTESALAPESALPDESHINWDDAVAELDLHKKIIKKDIENFNKDPNAVVTEGIHAVAFHGNTLGLPLVPKEHKLDQLNPISISQFISDNFSADRLVLSAANYDHASLVDLAKDTLGHVEKTSTTTEEARYTGGGTNMSGSGPATVAIGFKGVSWQDDDLVPICVLHTLLGGGGSFSSGGPGKGMYTRLYSQVLNRHGWVTSATAFNHCYTDTGLFGIQASCVEPTMMSQLVEVVGTQVGKMTGSLESGELDRAKAMTKSSLIMNLESRAIVCEDIGRQILSSGNYIGPEQLIKSIDAVTESDLQRVAERVVSSTPSVVTYGEDFASQDYATIESSIKSQGKLSA